MTRCSLLLSTAASAAATQKLVRLGGPIYLKSDDPRVMVREHRPLGYSAAYCPGADPTDETWTAAIAAGKVVIAEVRAWKNITLHLKSAAEYDEGAAFIRK